MLVIPAIDIRHGQCVRLRQGKESDETVYWKDPLEMALTWQARGARRLHIADLDGAFQGKPVNLQTIGKICRALPIPVQVGGGYRSLDAIERAVAAGVDRVIVGTAAVHQPELVSEAVRKHGGKVAVSIDVTDDFVAIEGWKEISTLRPETMIQKMRGAGVQHLLYTDTRKDGMLSGPNLAGIRGFLKLSQGMTVTASGGITSVDDVLSLKELEPLGLKGVIVGKALYDHRMTLQDAMQIAEGAG